MFRIRALKEILRENTLGEVIAGFLRSRRSYSQFGEDVFIEGIYDRLFKERGIEIERGTIVDVGCFRPVVYSNSYRFFRRGWASINIDPSDAAIAAFRRSRPQSINLACAVGPEATTAIFYNFGSRSVYNTLHAPTAAEVAKRLGADPSKTEVPVIPLRTLLEKHLLEPETFEILSVDAEGYDVEIIKSNDWNQFRPRIVIVERHNFDFCIEESELCQFMKKAQYVCYAYCNPNLVFLDKGSSL
ncbi:putative SAM-dependent methyltransferase [Oceanicaulis sp. 350]|nr:putative SAM-dependent methyltransferase [Oceanicaulis sp. 350]